MFVYEVIGRAQDFSRLRGKNPSKKDRYQIVEAVV